MTEEKNIELRSEEVQEVLGTVPVWILRWGTTTIFVFVVAILIGSWIFKYPDTISATMTLTGEIPPAGIIAKTNGRIKELYIKDNQQVKAKKYLAVLENPASTKDMLLLKNNLEKLIQTADYFMDFQKQELRLGIAQSVYTSFIRSLNSYQKLVELNYYPRKIAVVEERILQYKQQYQNFELQQTIAEQQHSIAGNLFKRDSLLYLQKVISQEEMEKSEKDYIQNRSSFENSRTTLKSLQIQISQLQESLLDIEQQYAVYIIIEK